MIQRTGRLYRSGCQAAAAGWANLGAGVTGSHSPGSRSEPPFATDNYDSHLFGSDRGYRWYRQQPAAMQAVPEVSQGGTPVGRSPCPLQKGTGELIRYHPVTPQVFAPPRGTACTTCTTKGKSEQAKFTSAACSRPTADLSNTASTGVGSTPSSRRPGNWGGRDVVVLHQSDLVACKGSSRHITGPENKHMGGAGAEVSFCREK